MKNELFCAQFSSLNFIYGNVAVLQFKIEK